MNARPAPNFAEAKLGAGLTPDDGREKEHTSLSTVRWIEKQEY